MENVIEKFPILSLTVEEAKRYINGVRIKREELSDGLYRVYINNALYGTAIISGGVVKSSKKIF